MVEIGCLRILHIAIMITPFVNTSNSTVFGIGVMCGDKVCLHGGICNITIPACICEEGFTGLYCQDEVGSSKPSKTTVTLLPIACGVVFMYLMCFIIMYVNTWRTNRQARARQTEIDSAVHVDGPPRFRNRHRRTAGQRRGLVLNPSSFIRHFIGTRRQSPSRESVAGLHGVRTAPAVLQGGLPPKYDYVMPSDEDSQGSFATVAGSQHNVVPPSYEEATQEQLENEQIIQNESTVSSTGGLSMRTIPSQASTLPYNFSNSDLHIDDDMNTQLTNVAEDLPSFRPSVGILVTFSSPLEETMPNDVIEMTTRQT